MNLQNRNKITDIANRHDYQEGNGGGINWENEIDIYRLP